MKFVTPTIIATLATGSLLLPTVGGAATRTVDEHRPIDPGAQVDFGMSSGDVEFVGWDKAELAVTGTLASDRETVQIEVNGARGTISVTNPTHTGGWTFGIGTDTRLVVHVPQRTGLSVHVASADVRISGINGDQDVRTVSGDIETTVQRQARIHTVSGDVQVTAGSNANALDLASVSGDITVHGGGGEVTLATVSGDAELQLGTVTHLKAKSVSGDFKLGLTLAPTGRLETESVSGDTRVDFAGGMPPADFDVQSLSGDLVTCAGRKGTREGFGPQTRLAFREGEGTAQVHIDSKSGDVNICSRK